jgi:hypothetical protein
MEEKREAAMKGSVRWIGALALATLLAGCAARHPVPCNVNGRY